MLYKGFIKDDLLRSDAKETMYLHGLKVADVADAIGYSEASLYGYLSGRNKSKPIADKLIMYFGYEEGRYNAL